MSGEIVHTHRSPLNCAAAFDFGGQPHMIIGSYTGDALLFRANGAEIEHLGTFQLADNAIKGVACDENSVLCVCANGQAILIPFDAWEHPMVLPGGHAKIANAAAPLPDGGFATVGRDRDLILWHACRGEHVPAPHSHSLKSLAVCRTSGVIAVGDYSGAVAVFDPDKSRWSTLLRPTRWGISSIAASEPGCFQAASYDGNVYSLAYSNGFLNELPPPDRQ